MNLSLPDKHLAREDYLDMRNRIVSFIHGAIGIVLAGYHTYFLHNKCGQTNTEFEKFIIANSAGYFLYDYIVMWYFGLMDKAMFIHHNICVIGMVSTLCQGISAGYLVAGLFISEVSNPVMHARLIIKHFGLRYTKAYEVSEVSYIMLFIYGRVLVGTSVVMKTVTCEENHWLIKVLCIGLAL